MTAIKPWAVPTSEVGQYSAKEIRQATSAGYLHTGPNTVLSGVLGAQSLVVTQTGTPSLAVTVSAGHAILQGGSVGQGAYVLSWDAAETLAVAAPSVSLNRFDIVVAQVNDADDGVRTGFSRQLAVITGTPATSPVPPSTPTDSILLATVLVAANASSIVNGNIVDQRRFTTTQGGIMVADSTTLESATVDAGQLQFATNTKAVSIFDGALNQSVPTVAVPAGFVRKATTPANPKMHWGAATINTDAAGFATVTHNAGFTPSVVIPVWQGNALAGPATGLAGADTITSTTFRTRMTNGASGSFFIGFVCLA